ncbi:AraC family transcriptional regulator [Reichenbachiella versicolor]|uniref:AraC family transcriptional regulator n=1 Tax=Reichenbachiella versicolor TaxID=1821036 RepID=UPI000D6E840E|nr:AraC family transcriptional regulator [Reichenbachiella versicolor]
MKTGIPTYSIDQFKSDNPRPYSIEVFDANRHFEVEYPHCHDFFEVLYLTQGSGEHIIDSNSYKIEPYSIFFLSPGQAHKLELSEDVKGYIFLFTGEFYLLDKSNQNRLLEYPFFFNVKQDNPPLRVLSPIDQEFLTGLFKKGCEEIKREASDSQDFAHALLELILTTCERLYPKEHRDGVKQKGHVLVKRFRELIEEKYQDNLSIKEYADLLKVSENHLTQLVKERTSKTSKELIRQKQIIEIKRLLKYSDLSVTQISSHLNFKDQSYFTKFFKRSEGITPIEYRENH